MSAHRLPADLSHAPFSLLDPGNGATLQLNRDLLYCTLAATTSGGETRTLPAPLRPGMTVSLSCGTFTAGDNIVVSVLNTAGATTGTVTFTAAGQWVQLWSFELATGVYSWAQTDAAGVTSTMPAPATGIVVPTQTQTALTDSTGGTASTTLAAITAGASYTQADMTAVKNALASLAAELALVKSDVAAILTAI